MNSSNSFFKNPIPTVLRTVIFYDAAESHIQTLKEHLESFEKYADGQCYYLPSRSAFYDKHNGDEESFDFSIFFWIIAISC